jgi:CelD/BcsL family acetyltransferase involved in cellulose biosynthesis
MAETLQVEIMKAEALGAADIALWRAWSTTNPALSSPYFRWDYAEIASRVCPGAAVAVFRGAARRRGSSRISGAAARCSRWGRR